MAKEATKKTAAKKAAAPTKSVTPAKPAASKSTAPAAKKVAVKQPAKVPAAPAAVEVKPVAVKKAAVKKVAVKKAAANAKPVITKVVAKIDAGFGNIVYLRGSGPGLSWEGGVAMTNVSTDTWEWSTTAASDAFEAKLVLNDEIWAAGENILVSSGATVSVEPYFG